MLAVVHVLSAHIAPISDATLELQDWAGLED